VPDHILAMIKDFLSKGIDVDTMSEEGETPLMAACRAGAYKTVQLLLEQQADVNAPGENGTTPLMSAAQGRLCHVGVIELLLEKGAKVGTRDGTGKTAVEYARANSIEHCKKAVELLESNAAKN